MNEPSQSPKSLWKEPWKGPRRFLWWTLLVVATFIVVFVIGAVVRIGRNDSVWFATSAVIAVALAAVAGMAAFFVRWICCWRNFRRFLFGIVCLVTLIALVYAEEDWRGKHNWEKFKREWEAKGEKFDFAGVIPPPVPDDQNFALTPILFTTYGNMLTREGKFIPSENRDTNFVDRLTMPLTLNEGGEPTNGGSWARATLTDLKPWQNYYRGLAATTNYFPVSPQPQSPAQDVLLALSKYDATIDELRQASRLPYSRFPLYYGMEPPFAILLPHLAPMKGCAQLLQLRAVAELQNNQADQALADIKLSLRLTEAIRTEPFIISHLVRIAMMAINSQPIYEGLAEHRWSDTQLAELDAELAKLDFLADYEYSIRGERACGIEGLEYMRRTRDLNFLGIGEAKQTSFKLIPSAFFYQNELTLARMHQQWTLPLVDDSTRTVSPETVQRNEISATNELNHFSLYNRFAREIFPAISKAVKKYVRGQSTVDLARVAIALERYHLAHGSYPESLETLAPQFMKQIPKDIIGGQPLKYRRTGNDQFILYSIGWNQKDDGGTVVLAKGSASAVDTDRGDWVWQYPAR